MFDRSKAARPVMPLLAIVFCLAGPQVARAQRANMALRVDQGGLVRVLRHPTLEPWYEFTLEFWIKTQSWRGTGFVVRKHYETDDGYSISMNDQGLALSGAVRRGNPYRVVNNAPNSELIGFWRHVALTVRVGTELRLYVDGQLRRTAAAPPLGLTHSGDFLLGGYYRNLEVGNEFIGLIDEVRFWNRRLSPTEVRDNMHRILEDVPGLVSSWHLDGDADDSTGFNDGEVIGNASFVPSDCPVNRILTLLPAHATWRGGTFVDLTGPLPPISTLPEVRFGAVPSPRVEFLSLRGFRVEVPPGTPQERVLIELDVQGTIYQADRIFTYTPFLEGPSSLALGRTDRYRFHHTPPATVLAYVGIPPRTSFQLTPYVGRLETVPQITLFDLTVPFSPLVLEVTPPVDPNLLGFDMILQALVGPDLPGGIGAFTNSIDVVFQ